MNRSVSLQVSKLPLFESAKCIYPLRLTSRLILQIHLGHNIFVYYTFSITSLFFPRPFYLSHLLEVGLPFSHMTFKESKCPLSKENLDS